ncbi:MAG: toll/interleukin-1 receptor domain-containing protein [Candidatus Contendobacter sp.]|nr:toll/interleukin-1 receptor domain-containing protein [Candidatus Contendobacter sp.]
MTQPLFDVVVLHHAADPTAAARVKALRQAFEVPTPETDTPQYANEPDPWTYVNCAAYSDPAEFERRAPAISKRALFVILVTEKMVDDPAWGQSLDILASALPRKADQGTRNALCFASSEAAQGKLPGRLRERQAPESSVLGERRLRPHTLALLALHRARLLLGAAPNQNKLTLFISHAKADGLFLALSLRSLIQEVPELENWYDADDIQSGADWSETIEAAAANSVLVAIRTEGYDQSAWCRREFETALAHGVPIVVVDALLRPTVTASSLPFAAMPTVRIPDGNTHRVLTAALREHVRLLLVETLVAERVPQDAGLIWRVWPRFPTLSAIQRYASVPDITEYWLVPQATQVTTEFNAARDWLGAVKSPLRLESVDGFLLLAGTLAAPNH